MKRLWWWLQECWWTFPFKPRRKSPVGDGQFGAYIPADLFKTFKDVGANYPLGVGVYKWEDATGGIVRVEDDKE